MSDMDGLTAGQYGTYCIFCANYTSILQDGTATATAISLYGSASASASVSQSASVEQSINSSD